MTEFSDQLSGENTLELDVTELQNYRPEAIQETVHNRNCEDEAVKGMKICFFQLTFIYI